MSEAQVERSILAQEPSDLLVVEEVLQRNQPSRVFAAIAVIGILAESRLHGFDALRQSNSEHFFVGRSATKLRPAQGQWRVAPVIDGSVVLFQAPPDPGNEHGDVHAVIPINERAPHIITAGMPRDLDRAILLERWLLWAGFQSR